MSKVMKLTMFFTVSAILGLLCICTFIYSIFGIGRWEGMAIGFYSLSALFGISIGTAISPFVKKAR
ncbi:YesK family protein [Bacillus haikouensis]|uniref:YesK family protein n=1 Tax=Bacillus haikouensis TaxID=1510468 RepID=UPI0035E457B4